MDAQTETSDDNHDPPEAPHTCERPEDIPDQQKCLTEEDDTKINDEEDDLEEGELKDDDDDDDDDDEVNGVGKDKSNASRLHSSPSRSRSSSKDSILSSNSSKDEKSSQSKHKARSQSSSSSSRSSISKDPSSSKSSSRIGSHNSPLTRSSSSNYDPSRIKRLSSARLPSNDRYRSSRDRDRQDPSEKAAKLISMRTKLLEARSREIEMKLNKNRNVVIPSQKLTLTLSGPQRVVKMTIAKPTISYSENPNPPPPEISLNEAIKAKKDEEHAKKEKKKRKKKKKHSSKKVKRRKTLSPNIKETVNTNVNTIQEEVPPPYQNTDHQGPRTPPDNHVLTLDDRQIEWPSHLIRMTTTIPSISYSVNPKSLLETTKGDRDKRDTKKQKKSLKLAVNGKRKKRREDRSSSSSSSSTSSSSSSSSTSSSSSSSSSSSVSHSQYGNHPHGKPPAQARSIVQPKVYSIDLNADYLWYYDYFINSYGMSQSQAQHQAYSAVVSAGIYKDSDTDKWLSQRGMSRDISGDDCRRKLYPFSLKDVKSDLQSTQLSAVKHSADNSISDDTPDNSEQVFELETIATRISRNQVNRDVEEHLEMKLENTKIEGAEGSRGTSNDDTELTNQAGVADAPAALDLGSIKLKPVDPKFVVIKSFKEIILPNGQVLPPGTVQKIVHPYPRYDSEVLGPWFDFY